MTKWFSEFLDVPLTRLVVICHKRIPPSGYQAFIHEGVKTPLQSPLRCFGDEAYKAGKGDFRDLATETWNQKMDMHGGILDGLDRSYGDFSLGMR